jgi:hypothetical protein
MITIIYITCRKECKIEYFLDSLHRQLTQKTPPIQIVIVDSLVDVSGRRENFAGLIRDRFEYVHVMPKPTKWQGEHRVTKCDYFCAANPRNTGVCYAKYDYVAFVDDLGVLAPTWLEQVLDGQLRKRIYCGAYTKMDNMSVVDGIRTGGDANPGDIDSRLLFYKQDICECYDSHMFGSSFCMPLHVFLGVNGLNEECDSCGGEDYEFGIRLKRGGHILYYNKRMFIHEDKNIAHIDAQNVKIRDDPAIRRDDFLHRLEERGIRVPHSMEHRMDFSHFLLYSARYGPIRVNPSFDLNIYRNEALSGKSIPYAIPSGSEVHPFTKIPLKDLP